MNWQQRGSHSTEEESKQQTNKQTHNLQSLFVNVDIGGNQLAVMEYYVLFVLYSFYANCMQIKIVSNELNE